MRNLNKNIIKLEIESNCKFLISPTKVIKATEMNKNKLTKK